jgi:hypothetical protein
MSDTTHEDAYIRAQHFQTIQDLVYNAQQPLLDDSNTYLKMVQRGQIESTPSKINLSRTDLSDRVSSNYNVSGNTKSASNFGFYSDISTGLLGVSSGDSYKSLGNMNIGYKSPTSPINYS